MTGVPDAIAQLLDKLVENALDFAPAGKRHPRLALGRRPASRGSRVANEGPPIPAEVLPRLFDAMVSARDEGQGRGGHLGLGLAIVRLVAVHHGGGARAVNLPDGRGVLFEVELAPAR